MDNNGIDTNEDLIDLRDRLTIFILDCFDHSDLNCKLDSEQKEKLQSFIKELCYQTRVSVISQKESLEWMNFLTSFLEGPCCSKEIWKENFEYFIQSIIEARELCNKIRIFTWDFEFRPNESVSVTSQDRDKAKSLMKIATAQIQKHLNLLDNLQSSTIPEEKIKNGSSLLTETQIQNHIASLYTLLPCIDNLQHTIKKLYENENDIPEKLRDWKLNIVRKNLK
jgi:hypothetical protein